MSRCDLGAEGKDNDALYTILYRQLGAEACAFRYTYAWVGWILAITDIVEDQMSGAIIR